MHPQINIVRAYMPYNFAAIAKNKLRREGYKGITEPKIYYTIKTGGGYNSKAILRVLAGMQVNQYQTINSDTMK